MQDSPAMVALRGNTISPLQKSQKEIDNMSLTNYSWDKTLFEGLQSKKLNTEEDQALYSYSKLSVSDGTPEKRQLEDQMELQYHYSKNYQSVEDKYDPFRDYPLLTKPKTVSTTVNSNTKSDDLQTISELSKRISQDQQTIQRLQEQFQEKDKIIYKFQRAHASTLRRHSQVERQLQKAVIQIQKLEEQVSVAEEQLSNSLRQLNYLEKENVLIKNERLVWEKQFYEQMQKMENLSQQKDILLQELDQTKEMVQNQLNKINKLSFQLKDQSQMIEHQENQILHYKSQKQLTQGNSQDPFLTYRDCFQNKRNSKDNEYDYIQMTKFVECIVDMVSHCQPTNTEKQKPKYIYLVLWQKKKKKFKKMLELAESYIRGVYDPKKARNSEERLTMEATKSQREQKQNISKDSDNFLQVKSEKTSERRKI